MGDEARKKIIRRKKVSELMDAAFDNELATVEKLLAIPQKDGVDVPIDPNPAKQNSPLGEAACGNAVDVVKLLLGKGANINHVGEHGRTPLARALANDAIEVVPLLLEAGADPRLLLLQERDEPTEEFPEGQIKFREWNSSEVDSMHCCSEIKKMLKEWDIGVTLRKLKELEGGKTAAAEAEAAATQEKILSLKEKTSSLERELQETREAYKATLAMRELRIKEYDTAKCEGRTNVNYDQLANLIEEAMKDTDKLKIRCDELELLLKKSNADVRKQEVESSGGMRFNVSIGLQQVEDVAILDVGGEVAQSKKPCLIVDGGGQATTFLTYRSVLMIDIGNSHQTHESQLSLSILGALRHGKVVVVNLRDKELPEAMATLSAKFDTIQPGLLAKVLDYSITDPAVYEPLLTEAREKENPELNRRQFSPATAQRFKFVLVTAQKYPDPATISNFYTVSVE